jgi:chemotaxis protein CheD
MEIMVGMGEIQATRAPAMLKAIGVGSCIALALYDSHTRIGGLAHILLPSINESTDLSCPNKFADHAVGALMDKMRSCGADVENVEAKVFGGANMFPDTVSPDSSLDIGRKNLQAVLNELKRLGIAVVDKSVGGNVSRTVVFDTGEGAVSVRNTPILCVD